MNNVAVIGLGSIAQRHRENLRHRFPKAKIYACSSSGRNVNEKINFCDNLVGSLDKLLNISLDLVIVASPASHHASHALPFIKKGIPTLIEKPLTLSANDAELLIKERDKSGCKVGVGYCLRFMSTMKKLKTIIEGNEFGKILHIECQVGQDLKDWRSNMPVSNTVSTNSMLGGGVVNELSHELDYLLWLFDEIKFKSGMLSFTGRYSKSVEDMADIFLVSKNSVPIFIHLDYLQQYPRRFMNILTESGRIKIDIINKSIDFYSKDNNLTIFNDSNETSNEKYLNMLEEFSQKINGQENEIVSLEEGKEVVRLIEKIKHSSDRIGFSGDEI
ncbi:MAG: Gfo/Idh/MocA family oxidoreductase [Oceanospirillaceae bacterium]|nr:Gfo/Idh/MocA family oxidoreductase [Oceanospirillaceae bacterium]